MEQRVGRITTLSSNRPTFGEWVEKHPWLFGFAVGFVVALVVLA